MQVVCGSVVLRFATCARALSRDVSSGFALVVPTFCLVEEERGRKSLLGSLRKPWPESSVKDRCG